MLFYYSLKGFRLCNVDTRGRNYIHKLKKKNLFSYMTLKNNNFSIFLGFFPYNSKNKVKRQKSIPDSDSTWKNTSINRKKHPFLYDLKRQ